MSVATVSMGSANEIDSFVKFYCCILKDWSWSSHRTSKCQPSRGGSAHISRDKNSETSDAKCKAGPLVFSHKHYLEKPVPYSQGKKVLLAVVYPNMMPAIQEKHLVW